MRINWKKLNINWETLQISEQNKSFECHKLVSFLYFDKYVFKYKVLTITNNDDNSTFARFLKTRIYLCKIIFKNNQQLILFVFDDYIITTKKHYFFLFLKNTQLLQKNIVLHDKK